MNAMMPEVIIQPKDKKVTMNMMNPYGVIQMIQMIQMM